MAADPMPIAAPTTAVFLVILGGDLALFRRGAGFFSLVSSNAMHSFLPPHRSLNDPKRQADPR